MTSPGPISSRNAQEADTNGPDGLWGVEVLGRRGGFDRAATVPDRTRRIPGRLDIAIGHGIPD
ncbi:hypothetical protein [Streptomyces sp. NBC_00459]|uniref:hypothetical protein n=1 Tax=Streptomyces sp. NBC_00459 TaxID=2975749 RepID=UPI002E1997B7